MTDSKLILSEKVSLASPETVKNRHFLGYINNFRGMAILFIVFGHCISAFDWHTSENVSRILKIFFSNGTVLFVFIAGYLFQYLSGKFLFSRYFYNKILNVGLPYIVCSIPAILYFIFIDKRWDLPPEFYLNSKVIQIIEFYLTGAHITPFWFIPMIFLYYLISPVLVFLDQKNLLYYLLPFSFIVSCYVGRGTIPENFVHFFSVYIFGMFCSKFKQRVNYIITLKTFLLVDFLLILVFSYIQFFNLIGSSYLQKLCLTIFILAIFYSIENKFSSKSKNIFEPLAVTSFGVFFIHSYIISGIKLIVLKFSGEYFHGTVLNYFFFSFFILFISTVIILFGKKILGSKSRYIIGS